MAEDDARGDLLEPRVTGGIDRVGAVFWPVMGEWCVQVELALVDEFEDSVGEDGFGEGGGRETGVVGNGGASGGINCTEAPERCSAAVFDQSDGEAGDVGLLHEGGDVACE